LDLFDLQPAAIPQDDFSRSSGLTEGLPPDKQLDRYRP